MFSNLIESSSHAREFKRRGSFILFTSSIYSLLFIIAGVTSIYAYDARLNDPDNGLELLSYVPSQAASVTPEPVRTRHTTPTPRASNGPRSTRPVLLDTTDNPLNPPHGVSAVAPTLPPAHAGTEIGRIVAEPSGSGGDHEGSSSGSYGSGSVAMDKIPEPPPAPAPAPPTPKIIKAATVLNGLAMSLPKPAYPPIAKQAHIQGAVNVQVLVDEMGRVVSAKAVSGSPTLMPAAQEAAKRARFSPTTISGQPVKVSGVIIYNFVLQ